MTGQAPLRIGIVAGEESGDLLGADLVQALKAITGRNIELFGVGGEHLAAEGLKSIFDPADITIVGMAAIVRDFPRLLRHIKNTSKALAAAKPDCIVTIDSPEFSLRVAKRVRAHDPSIPIIHYVCPSVWAWRPGRAAAMKPHVDHVLCVLPFEPAELQRLGGPPGTYVGHRLATEPGVLSAAAVQTDGQQNGRPTLLLLPGSRRSEVGSLLGIFGETVSILRERGNDFRLVLPTVPRAVSLVRDAIAGWSERPEVVVGAEAKWRAFGEARGALAASGTVTLELALCGVPLVSCYRIDRIASMFTFLLTSWSASLPNLIADRPVVPERYQETVRANLLARDVEAILGDTAYRRWQLDGFAEVRRRMATEKPAGPHAAEIVLGEIARRRP